MAMVDFDKLRRQRAALSVKTHAIYTCPTCGDTFRCVHVLPRHLQHGHSRVASFRWCPGVVTLTARVFVPKGHVNYDA
jgi:hypothetical protein